MAVVKEQVSITSLVAKYYDQVAADREQLSDYEARANLRRTEAMEIYDRVMELADEIRGEEDIPKDKAAEYSEKYNSYVTAKSEYERLTSMCKTITAQINRALAQISEWNKLMRDGQTTLSTYVNESSS